MAKQKVILSLEEQVRRELAPVRITKQAFDKANYVSKRICELFEGGMEVGFFLLGDVEQSTENRVIEDVCIGHEQDVTPTRCDISGFGVIKSYHSIKRESKRRIVGWGHSHGKMSTFYSDIDDNTIIEVLSNLGMKKIVGLTVPPRNASARFVIDEIGRYLEISLGDDKFRLHHESFGFLDFEVISGYPIILSTLSAREIRYTYGITFNANADNPFCVIAYQLDGKNGMVKNAGYEIVEDGDRSILDREKIDQELVERVVNLRRRYETSAPDIEGDYENARNGLISCKQISRRLSSRGVEDVLRDADSIEDHFCLASELYNRARQLDETVRRYDRKTITGNDEESERHRKYIECMRNLQEDLLGELASQKDRYCQLLSAINAEIERSSGILSHIPCSKSFWLKKLSEVYSNILEMIDKSKRDTPNEAKHDPACYK